MALTTMKQTSITPNFIASEIGLVLSMVDVDSTGITADEYGYKTVKGGTIYPTNDSGAKGIIFEDVDVTTGTDNGIRPASLIVGGRILANRLHTELSSAAKTALTALGIIFVDEPITCRSQIESKDYTAGTTAFAASDIATNESGASMTITAIDTTGTNSAVATVALSSSTHKVTATKVATGTTNVKCTVIDTAGCTADITVKITMA